MCLAELLDGRISNLFHSSKSTIIKTAQLRNLLLAFKIAVS
jgi:hypothetical protein